MKAISLTQPWASLVARGYKRMETRSWPTKYRGPLAIHAAKRYPGDAQHFAFKVCLACLAKRPLPVVQALMDAHHLPRGVVIATCTLVDCIPTEKAKPSEQEAKLGDYSPGRFAWVFKDIHSLEEPVAAKGRLGLWEWNGG